jgi:preprotein translocase subunit YajC
MIARGASRGARLPAPRLMLEPMFITPAYAQAAGGPAAQGGGLAAFISFAPLILVFAVFWLLMIRPQQQRVKALQRAIDAVKKGDNVVTGGGIIGKVTRVEDSEVEVEIAPNTRIRVVKATLTEVINPNATAAND